MAEPSQPPVIAAADPVEGPSPAGVGCMEPERVAGNGPLPVPACVQALMVTLREARYPKRYDVDRATLDAYEGWLMAEKDRRVAEWRAAGSPDDWPEDLWPIYAGPTFGVMLKGVELCLKPDAPSIGSDVPGGGAV